MIPQETAKVIEKVIEEKGYSVNHALISSKAGKDLIANMRKGSKPNIAKVTLLADYLGVSTEYLLTGEKPAPAELIIPEELKNVRVAFHRGEFEDLTQDEIDRLAEFARFIKSQRSDE